jgi:hypothetical protein
LKVFLDLGRQGVHALSSMGIRFRFAVLGVPLALAACGGAGTPPAGVSYRAQGVRNYAAPGTPEDPWGPYIREAAAKYGVPEAFIREVMRQESGGHEYLNGQLTTSSAGAMGLMQVMPGTYESLSARYGLGPDAYDPHDNIMAGTALIHELYQQYGSPAFLAAYDAGPSRLDDYLAGRGELPNETIAYLDTVAPRLVGAAPMTGPLIAFAGQPDQAPSPSPVPTQAPLEVAEAVPPPQPTVAGSQIWQPEPVAPPSPAPSPAPALVPTPPPVQRPAPTRFALIPSAYADTRMPSTTDARWGVQVGAFAVAAQARQTADTARGLAPAQLHAARTEVSMVQHLDGQVFFRARLVGITEPAAGAACHTLTSHLWQCLAVPPGG